MKRTHPQYGEAVPTNNFLLECALRLALLVFVASDYSNRYVCLTSIC